VEIKEIDRSSALIEIKLKMELVNVGVIPNVLLSIGAGKGCRSLAKPSKTK
jgi:hypothetical protein